MGYTALYRKWRPETFDDIVGQDTIVKTLENQINLGRIGHAYLFSGPRGTGKTSTAKVFAKAVNCTDDKNANPCGKCKVCLRSAAGDMLDIIEIDAASNNGVDEIRDLRNKAKFPPTLGRFKIYIIDEVHMLSQGAFNALLKTLEEPPPHVIFILATTEAHRLPATIISRCQHFAFKLILLKDIVDHLRSISQISNITIDDEALYTIARWAQGGLRDAISLFDQCIGFSGNKISNEDVLSMLGTANEPFMFEMVDAILEGDITFAFNSVDMLIQDGRDISIFVRDIITHMRNLLIIKASNNKASSLIDASPSTVELYKKQAKTAGQMRVFRAVDLFVSLESELKWSNQPR
ncbi:MAG: DNA polymerase III subunit gamma/tau, partial [Clostridiales bacterium]|nr:DNA polymerase III subunit gamma/tau [Clostridiales bacterium]